MVELECICSAPYCAHEEMRCGKPVAVRLRVAVSLGPAQFAEPVEVGICEECYAKGQEVIPWAFPQR